MACCIDKLCKRRLSAITNAKEDVLKEFCLILSYLSKEIRSLHIHIQFSQNKNYEYGSSSQVRDSYFTGLPCFINAFELTFEN